LRPPASVRLVLALALSAAALAAGSPAAVAQGSDCIPGASWSASRADLATQVVDLVNRHRGALGLRRLAVSRGLTAVATWKARHMATYGYMDHDDPAPVGRSFAQRIADCAPAGLSFGENIAYGQRSARAVMTAWLHSAGHRRNIERSQFAAIGVGVAVADDGTLYWAQDFGSGVGAARSRAR
jgi:uncharacterized protein YkwD